MVKKMIQALNKDAKAQHKILQKSIDAIMTDIHWQFDSMIEEKVDDVAEEKLKQTLREFLEKAEQDFEDIRTELKRIKRKYDTTLKGGKVLGAEAGDDEI